MRGQPENIFQKLPVKRLTTVLNKLGRQEAIRKVRYKMQISHEQASPPVEKDEELIDTLIAISVVAKRLAQKLRQETKEENPSEQD